MDTVTMFFKMLFSNSGRGCEPQHSVVSCLVFLVTKMNFKIGRQRLRVQYLVKATWIDMGEVNLGRNLRSHYVTPLPKEPSRIFPLPPVCSWPGRVHKRVSMNLFPPPDPASMLLSLFILHLTFNTILIPNIMELHI